MTGDSRVLMPPLRVAWRFEQGFQPVMPVLHEGLAFLLGKTNRCVAVAEYDGNIVWQAPPGQRTTPLAASDVGLLVAVSKGGSTWLELWSPEDGSVRSQLDQANGIRTVLVEPFVFTGGFDQLVALRVADGKRIWSVRVGQGPTTWMSGSFDATAEYACFGLRGGAVVCLDSTTGKERWRRSVADTGATGGSVDEARRLVIHAGTLIVATQLDRLVAFSLASGRRRWVYVGGIHPGQLVDGCYQVEAGELDPKTGFLTPRPPLQWPETLQERGVFGQGDWAISKTHIFSGTNDGYLIAWERRTGDYVWHTKPKGAFSAAQGGTPLLIHNGRLYYGDNNCSVYCLEGVTPAGLALTSVTGGPKPSRSQPRKMVDLKAKKPREARKR